jgi:hypothetical protein
VLPLIDMTSLKKVEKRGRAETKSMPHTPVVYVKFVGTLPYIQSSTVKTRRIQCKCLCLYVEVNIANEDKKLQTPTEEHILHIYMPTVIRNDKIIFIQKM